MLQQLQNLASDDTIHGYQTRPLLEFFPENRCLNGCNVLFVESWVEDYQPLAQLSYSAYVCWRFVHVTRVKRYLSVHVSINVSIPKRSTAALTFATSKLLYLRHYLCTHNYENYVTFKVVP